jgi:putative membrane protein
MGTLMMGWYGSGMGTAGWFVMGAFWIALVVLVVWLVIRLLPTSKDDTPKGTEPRSALETLDRRLASGEIDVESYREARTALEAGKTSAS